MRKAGILWGALTLLAFAVRPALALPTVDELLAKIAKAASQLNSYSSDAKATITAGPGKGVFDCTEAGVILRKDGKVVSKSCVTMKGTVAGPNGEQMQFEHKTVNDGKYLWEETKVPQMDVTIVVKKKGDAPDPGTGLQPQQDSLTGFEQTKEMYTLRLTGEDTLNGQKVYLLEGDFNEDYLKKNPKARTLLPAMKTVKFWVNQEDLYWRKMAACDPDGHETMIMEVTNAKLNGKVDETLFDYTPPEGAQVQDMTEAGN